MPASDSGAKNKAPTISRVLGRFRSAFVGIAAISFVVNLLALTGAIFMLQVYDRVLPGRSVPTLVSLAIIACVMFVFQGVLEMVRSRLLVRIGVALDAGLSADTLQAVMKIPLRAKLQGDGLQPVRDLDQVRSFLSGAGPTAFFDLPWLPIYVGICFVFHFWIGVTALAGALVLVGLTLLTEFRTRQPARQSMELAASRNAIAEASRRNAEALQAMGFGHRVAGRWLKTNAEFQEANARTSDVAGSLATISRVFRLMLQSAVLGVGAWLVVHGEATGGIMIAASIMTSRALAPIELAIGNWKGFVAARQGWRRLQQLLGALPENSTSIDLPRPANELKVENVSVVAPGDKRAIVQDATFSISKGTGLGIIGPSASGKSSLVRAMAGIWQPARGAVRLDGATLDQWAPAELGKDMGYLPQDVQLFAGTIAENISRFDPEADSKQILAAAHTAGVHSMIVQFPDGYDTQVGEGGAGLSAGQRQRIALARALYGDPFLVILDEPNSNLDADGETALARAIQEVRKRDGIVVVVAHRPSALANLDQVLVMGAGRVQAFGPKDEVLSKMLRPAQAPVPLKVVPEGA